MLFYIVYNLLSIAPGNATRRVLPETAGIGVSWERIVSSAHFMIPMINLSTSSLEFPACRHTRTRSLPLGTVGQVIGRAFMPKAKRYAESGRGCAVRTGTIGEGGKGLLEE